MIGEIIFMLFLWVSGILSAIGLGFAAYFVLSAPFRRTDCANLVVELNELAAATGQTPEQLFRELGAGKISDVPYQGKFRRLHSLMQRGDTFIESLRRFHSLLPGEIFCAMELARNERSTRRVDGLTGIVSSVERTLTTIETIESVTNVKSKTFQYLAKYWSKPKARS